MSRITWYNFEKYSIIDVKNYLELSGYETEIIPESGSCAAKLHVKGTDIHVDFPVIDINAAILADIRFESYPKMENHEKRAGGESNSRPSVCLDGIILSRHIRRTHHFDALPTELPALVWYL